MLRRGAATMVRAGRASPGLRLPGGPRPLGSLPVIGTRPYGGSTAEQGGLAGPALLERIIRVDHAGEYGADRIYAGQLAVLGGSSVAPVIKRMWDQEKEHLAKFEELISRHRVRPTALLPLWNVAGFLLGAGSALLGKEGAMACTVAVEESISEHYNNQIRTLVEEDPEKHAELLELLRKFRDDEMEHHDTGLQHNAELAPAYALLKSAIQVGCKVAVYASERV
ncbi:NADPH-dependent 3-demethoxyubiquinone 3-hydroxylase, mitochondrial [Petromyzon marinus]|uniref:NADPH-dependent 3-demethoxyubiquinone 3-hydroxylase, mitochondrial n=1 Tax=Petromyzon marinus TaxID=7757 RepID=UPI003F704720